MTRLWFVSVCCVSLTVAACAATSSPSENGGNAGVGGDAAGGQPTNSGGASTAGGTGGSLNKGGSGGGAMGGNSGSGGAGGAGGRANQDAGLPPDAASSQGGNAGAAVPMVIDTHTHFWDSSRPNPQGRSQPIAWPEPGLKQLYRPVLPAEYLTKTKGTGITSTIVVEASGWLEDNQWILDLASQSPVIVGFVGSFGEVIGTNKFDAALKRFSANPLFRGIRIGSGEVSGALSSTDRLAEFTKLADADLEVDTLGVSLSDVAKLAVSVPKLRIVVDHMASVAALDPSSGWKKEIETLAKSAGAARIYLKLSGLVESAGNPAPVDPARYTAALEHVWQQIGEDHLLYSSNWPVSELNAPLGTVATILNTFLATKSQAARDKVFWKNAQAAYKWVPRK
jgi:L-fuconolactonase